MPKKRKVLSEEHKRKISEALKGRKHSEETKRKIGEAHKGRKHSAEARRNMSKGAKKKKLSVEHRRKISESLRKRVITEETREKLRQRALERGQGKAIPSKETRRKMSEARKGQRRVTTEKMKAAAKRHSKAMQGRTLSEEHRSNIARAMKGRRFTDKHLENLSKSRRGKVTGPDHPRWIDGRSYDSNPYPDSFGPYLKKKVRKRDGQTCQACGETAKGKKGHVHHIDGDKQNSKMDNLLLVCISCHNRIHGGNDQDNPRILELRGMLR